MKKTIPRLYKYRNVLSRFRLLGLTRIFSDDLAKTVGSTSVQIRKDFSLFNITGNKRGGYRIEQLIDQLDEVLGKKTAQRVILVGVGNIGRALLDYDGFAKEGIIIEAAFDIDPLKAVSVNVPAVYSLEKLKEYVGKNKIKIGIIAVPYVAAQQVADLMIAAGIKGILNFAPVNLKVPADCYVNNINVRLELETVGYFVRTLESQKSGSSRARSQKGVKNDRRDRATGPKSKKR